jgi:hypothetical protein
MLRPAKTHPRATSPALTDDQTAEVARFLAQLDEQARIGQFPYPQHDRMDYAAMRLHAYRGRAGFALVFELLTFDHEVHRLEQNHGFCNFLFAYSSTGPLCAWNQRAVPSPFARDPKGPSVSLTEDTDEEIESRTARQALRPDARAIVLRGKRVEVPHDPGAYRAKGIEPSEPIALRDLLRLLVATHWSELFSTDAERAKLTKGLTKLLTLDEWRHYRIGKDTAPSQTEAMRQLAEVLVTGEVSRYRPTEQPNTYWGSMTQPAPTSKAGKPAPKSKPKAAKPAPKPKAGKPAPKPKAAKPAPPRRKRTK